MVRMDSVKGGLPLWAAGSRLLLVILVILVGMCGNGSGMYMEGDMVTGDNWIFMARYSTLTFCFCLLQPFFCIVICAHFKVHLRTSKYKKWTSI